MTKSRKTLAIFTIIAFIIGFLFLIFIPKLVAPITFLLIIIYLLIDRDYQMLKLLGIATLISIVWVFLIKDFYGYNTSFQTLAGLNIFPLFAWAVGLFGAYSLFQVYMVKHDWKLIYKFLLFTAFYWIVLIAAETIMYHVFNFQNIATGIYSGLPICNCLHAPLFMQIGYFAIGPIYFLISSLLKNPYINVTKNPFTLKN